MKPHASIAAPQQAWDKRNRTAPVPHARTTRIDQASVITSGFGGKMLPVKAIPLLPEDQLRSSQYQLTVQMAETASMLLNPVRITARMFLVPKLAAERYKDMGSVMRSFNGRQEIDGNVIPWFETESTPTSDFYKTLGLHIGAKAFNTDYLEAYNAIWNHMATERSPSLSPRAKNNGTLAPAFWEHTQMQYVKPTFDDVMIEGQVPLYLDGGSLPVTGSASVPISRNGPATAANAAASAQLFADQVNINASGGAVIFGGLTSGDTSMSATLTDAVAELSGQGVTVSLANIDLARQTAAWARLRKEFQGRSEDWMMDHLLAGVRLRDEALNQPILLGESSTVVGMTERYATDAANLDKSVADGQTRLEIRGATPPVECGGVVMVVVSAMPEQLYERQRDYYLTSSAVSDLPNRTADELDPQPVALVKNGEVDESHSTPNDLFGYAPLNHEWQRVAPNIGGKYFRPDPSAAWNEDRNRIWTPEVQDPTLGPDFFLSTSLSHAVFADTQSDPFEFWLSGSAVISGLTYFGPQIVEGTGDYEAVLAQVPSDRLKGDGSDT